MYRYAITLVLVCVSALAADAESLPVAVPAADKQIRYVGRFDMKDAAGPRCAWSGSAIVARFSGTAINAKFKGNSDHFQVILDGKPTLDVALANGQSIYRVADGLSD